MIMLIKLLIVGCLASLLSKPVLADVNDANYCGPKDSIFAHCAGHKRVFNTVALTIHGWNGSCRTTFGEDEEKDKKFHSIYSIFKDKRFFDLDCFAYDSMNFPIEDHILRLEKHMMALKNKGYDEVMFITHSTGGIIALDYLVKRLKKAINTNKHDEIKVPVIIAWATPIKGLRWHIIAAGNALNFFGVDQKTLPQLNEEKGNYLKTLRNKLIQYPTTLSKIPLKYAKYYDASIQYFHGDDDDWVVMPIKDSERKEGWIWESPKGELINTDVGHLANIGKAGNPVIHKYPARIIDSESIINLPLTINIDEVFPLGRLVYDENNYPFQNAMVHGVTYHAKRFKLQSNPDVFIRFLERLLLNDFPRSKEIDYLLLDELKNRAISLKLIEQSPAVLAGVLSFTSNVLSKYKSNEWPTKQSPGHGEGEFVKGILDFAGEIDLALNEIKNVTPAIQDARKIVASLMLNSLNSPQQEIQEATINHIAKLTPTYADNTIIETGLVDKLSAYYAPNASKLGGIAKEKIGRTLISMTVREGEIGAKASSVLNEKVLFAGESVPVWKSFQNEKLDQLMLASPDITQFDNSVEYDNAFLRERSITYAYMSKYAGSIGNQVDIIREAYKKGRSFFNVLPIKDKKLIELELDLLGKMEIKQGYKIQNKYDPTNWLKQNSAIQINGPSQSISPGQFNPTQ